MSAPFPYSIFPLGDSALTITFSNSIDKEINRHVLALFHELKAKNISGITDIVPAYSSLSLHYDVITVRQYSKEKHTAFEIICGQIEEVLNRNVTYHSIQPRRIKIPVCYSKEFAPDFEHIVSERKISREKIIELHTERVYTVYMIGFLPGFAYMGEVSETIATPRKTEPQTVATGSVGIAGRQTGIYPLTSPGGWQIIGRTPIKIFDKEKNDPVLLQPGDEVEFYSITEDEFKNY